MAKKRKESKKCKLYLGTKNIQSNVQEMGGTEFACSIDAASAVETC